MNLTRTLHKLSVAHFLDQRDNLTNVLKFKKTRLNVVAILIVLLAMPAITQATIINYTVSPLGGGQWQYDYMVQNDTLVGPIAEFTIYFQPNLYENLAVISSPLDWDSIVIQPDTALPADGFFDALSLSAVLFPGGADGLFSVSFNYLGAGTPYEQVFEIYDANFNLLDSGITITSPVPEPNTLFMLVIGLFLLFCYNNRRSVYHL